MVGGDEGVRAQRIRMYPLAVSLGLAAWRGVLISRTSREG
jgi:hypothetical protein